MSVALPTSSRSWSLTIHFLAYPHKESELERCLHQGRQYRNCVGDSAARPPYFTSSEPCYGSGIKARLVSRIDCYGTSISLCHSWRSLGESNPCFSLERGQVDPLHDHREESSVMETYGCQSRLGCTSRRDRTSFAPETAQPKRRERDRTETK